MDHANTDPSKKGCVSRVGKVILADVDSFRLDRRVMVVVTGEFGRTPRISHVASSGGVVASGSAGTVQPGRDHWPSANSMIWAGGGIRTGGIIGATDRRGEDVVHRRVGPRDFLATIYQHLGMDYRHATIPDRSGRPTPILFPNGRGLSLSRSGVEDCLHRTVCAPPIDARR